jgi:hypothetical protein
MAFSTHDIVSDSPTNNFCTMNPLSKQSNIVLSEGNLKTFSAGSDHNTVISTMSVSNGKWYFEVEVTSGNYSLIGIVQTSDLSYYLTEGNFVGKASDSYGWYGRIAYKYNNGSGSSYGSATSAGNIVGVALDLDAGTLTFYKNGVSQSTAFTGLSGTFIPAISVYNSSYFAANFGQDPTFAGNKSPTTTYTDANGIGSFYYQPPTDALALCTANLPDFTPDVTGDTPQDYFKAVTYTGNGGTNDVDTGIPFDLLWLKNRDGSNSHVLTDSVRGKGVNGYNTIQSNSTIAEFDSYAVQEFLSIENGDSINGMRLASNAGTNGNNVDFIAWCWKAGGAPTADNSNTSGAMTANSVSLNGTLQSNYTPAGSPTIYPKRMSINTDAGFSIVKWQASNGSDKTVPHGLSNSLDMIVMKNLDTGTYGWHTSHIGLTTNHNLLLNDTDTSWNPSTSGWVEVGTGGVFNIKNGTNGLNTNKGTDNYIAYCWHSVEGYSKCGSYVGNGSADGPFVYTGFRVRWLMVKRTDTTSNWLLKDTSRDPYNPTGHTLLADVTDSEYGPANTEIDILSNGWKSRTNSALVNATNGTYIFMAFAEQPFKYSNAR